MQDRNALRDLFPFDGCCISLPITFFVSLFFGRLIAEPSLHAQYVDCFSKTILHSEETLFYSMVGGGMLDDGFRVRAARRRGKAETNKTDKLQEDHLALNYSI